MATPELRPDGAGRLMTDRHPDTRQVGAAIRHLTAWLATEPRPLSPTSSVTGGGAVTAFELEFAARHDGRAAVLMPSATFGLYSLLVAMGVGAGDEVVVPVLDWSASSSAVRAVGATPVVTAVDPATLTLGPGAVARAVTARTAAVIACHLHGVAADVPAIADAAAGAPVIEDCAAALGSSLDGAVVGTMGAAAVFSLGPGKQLDCGEGGVVLARDPELHARVLDQVAHPLRRALTASAGTGFTLAVRPHPMTAMIAMVLLAEYDLADHLDRHACASRELAAFGATVLGGSVRRGSAQPGVPVLHPAGGPDVCDGAPSGCLVVPGAAPDVAAAAADLRARVRLLRTDR